MKCFYHADMDGKCSAAIVNHAKMNAGMYLKQESGDSGVLTEKIDFIEINYHIPFPFECINKNEVVYIVDFSLQKEGDFDKLLEFTKNIVWIDHHTTAIEKHKHLSWLKGIREHDKPAGCELAWKYFNPTIPPPKAVKLLGDYDTWSFKYGEETEMFQVGIKLEDTKPESSLWDKLLEDSNNYDSITQIVKQGKIAIKYRRNYCESLMKGFSYKTEFEGYKGIVCNMGITGSHLFESINDKKYDLMIPIVFDGHQWTVSIYSTTGVDCAEIAKKHGGGGHKNAAGFQCKKLPFERVDK